jgi:acetyl-CoA carboxylase alpha subunit
MALRGAISAQLEELLPLPAAELLNRRYQKFRQYGDWAGK